MAPPCSVLLVAPPFLSALRPSMGLSAIKGALNSRGITSAVWYLNIDLAARIGLELSEWISTSSPVNLLLGEWVFASLARDLTEQERHGDARYPYDIEQRLPAGTPGNAANLVQARQIAGQFIEDAAARIVRVKPRIVGISTSFQQTCAGAALAKRIKDKAPETVICFGGANCDTPMGEALLETFPQIDLVFAGEADHSFPAFVERHLAGEGRARTRAARSSLPLVQPQPDLKAVAKVIGSAPVDDMDALALPDMDDYFTDLAASGLGDRVEPGLVIEASRGCWWGAKHHCTFCGLNATTMAFRSKSSERVLQEIRWLSQRHQRYGFQAVDNILNVQHIAGVFDALATAEPAMKLFFEVKANMTHEQLQRSAKAGVTHVQPGIESLNDTLLSLMDKGVTALQNIAFLRNCAEIGIVPWWNMLYRLPGESEECYQQMQQLLPLIEHLYPPMSASPVRLDRFSPYFERAEQYGYREVEPFASYRSVFGVEPERAHRLAYFFIAQADNTLSRDRMLEFLRALEEWRNKHADAERVPVLSLVVNQGQGIIVDTRQMAQQPMLRVSATALALLARFRRPAPWARTIERVGNEHTDAAAEAEQLLARGMLLRIGDKATSVVCESGCRVHITTPPFPGGYVVAAADGITEEQAARGSDVTRPPWPQPLATGSDVA